MAGREAGTNRLLAALPRREQDRLLPQLEPVVLYLDDILYEPEAVIRHVYYPTSGLISLLLVMDDTSVAEVGRVGSEGIVGLPIFLGVPTSGTDQRLGQPPRLFSERRLGIGRGRRRQQVGHGSTERLRQPVHGSIPF